MPFDLCNASATFQRLTKRILSDKIGIDVLVYFDDVLMFGSDATALVNTKREVLQLLIQKGLKCKVSKCSLFTKRVYYVGHILTANGIEPDLIKIDKIQQWPKLITGPQLASFLGFYNYYRNLVPGLSDASVPLYAVSRQTTFK